MTSIVKVTWSQPKGDTYYWIVLSKSGKFLTFGYTETYDQAQRNVRNFVKCNQNLIYGE